jgi:hypothetical protein
MVKAVVVRYSMVEREINAYEILVRKREKKKQVWKLSYGWEDNIKMALEVCVRFIWLKITMGLW